MSVVPMPQSPTFHHHHHTHHHHMSLSTSCGSSSGGSSNTNSNSTTSNSSNTNTSMMKPKKPECAFTASGSSSERKPWVPVPKLTMEALGPVPEYNLSAQSVFEPFKFQVAGHDPILRLPEGIIFKPALARELWFYMNLSPRSRLLPWVPEFHGCIELQKDFLNNKKKSPKKNSSNSSMTPWGQKMHDEKLDSKPQTTRFMVMKDLTSNFERPCIMDVKLGTRAYGDDATESKMLSQSWKSNTTTSGSTGLRVCGVQVFQSESNDYFYFHKYEGRLVVPDDLKSVFGRFFTDGDNLRVNVIAQFITKLKELRRVIMDEPQFRFYATSLLLIYEGAQSSMAPAPTPVLKMIDFANTFPALPSGENDDGYLFGLNNFIAILEQILLDSPPSSPSEAQHLVYSQPQ
eukprot:TRINITY_DN176_c0_g1_i13.p1 TRINITY_DN176_c0_g1~~TRINITY_DN176_c0_g1_i13.p1  ORF type:complete len:403 (-),score=169.14 TRINITY_DN176_c0_g1_i13:1239-2447(-)